MGTMFGAIKQVERGVWQSGSSVPRVSEGGTEGRVRPQRRGVGMAISCSGARNRTERFTPRIETPARRALNICWGTPD